MGTASGFLRNFREQITAAIAESDTAMRGHQTRLDEERAENVRLRTLAIADGLVIGGASVFLMDSTATDGDDEERAA